MLSREWPRVLNIESICLAGCSRDGENDRYKQSPIVSFTGNPKFIPKPFWGLDSAGTPNIWVSAMLFSQELTVLVGRSVKLETKRQKFSGLGLVSPLASEVTSVYSRRICVPLSKHGIRTLLLLKGWPGGLGKDGHECLHGAF